LAIFRDTPVEHLTRIFSYIQPDEGVSLQMGAVPGTKVRMDKVEMNFHYTDYFGSAPSTGYETLIYD